MGRQHVAGRVLTMGVAQTSSGKIHVVLMVIYVQCRSVVYAQ